MKLSTSHPISSIPLGSPLSRDQSDAAPDISVFLPGYSKELAAVHTEDALIVPARLPVTPTRRLIVLVPEGDFDENLLAQRIWQMASAASIPILFLALSSDPESVAYLRRRLITLAAVTDYGVVRAHVRVEVGSNWSQELEETLHSGDLLVCMAGHRVPFQVIRHKALGELLSTSFNVPIYMLGGFQIGSIPKRISQIRSLSAWLASFAVIALFAGLQIWIDQANPRPISTLYLCISVFAEVFLILKVNEWIS